MAANTASPRPAPAPPIDPESMAALIYVASLMAVNEILFTLQMLAAHRRFHGTT